MKGLTRYQNINEGNKKVKQEPDLDHIDVGGDRQACNHRDEHAGQDQHDSQVYSNGRFKVERVKVAGDVTDDVEEKRRNVDRSRDA